MTDEHKTAETPIDPHLACGDKLDKLLLAHRDTIEVLKAHGRLLERHTQSIERHSRAIEDIGRVLHSVDAGIKGVSEAQRTQNQMTANLHQLYSRLECMRPQGGDDDDSEGCDFQRRSPSEEIRQLRLLGSAARKNGGEGE